MTGAEKYAKVCREGAVLGTGRCSLMTPSTKQDMLPLKLKSLVFATYASHSDWLFSNEVIQVSLWTISSIDTFGGA